MSQLRVEKGRMAATLTLSNGATIRGSMFLWQGVAEHTGQERVRDLLNAEAGFFPFEVQAPSGVRTHMFNRDHVLFATLDGDNELRSNPGHEVATIRHATVLLSNGKRLSGVVRVLNPLGRDRLSDFARTQERFQYLECDGLTYIINMHHLIELTESLDS
jgi:hypothetical protein